MKIPLLATVCLATAPTGCATADFTPYVGEQQKWPTAKGAFVTTVNSYDGPAAAEQANNIPCRFTWGRQIALTSVLGSVDVDTPVGRLFEPSAHTTTLKPA